MKEVFYQYDKLISSESLEIKNYQPTPCNVSFTNSFPYEGYYNAYFTVIRNPVNNKIHLYYRSSISPDSKIMQHSVTCVAISNDGGITFDKPVYPIHSWKNQEQELKETNIVIKGNGSSHNFTCCYDPKGKRFVGIGGLHTWQYENLHKECNYKHKLVKMKANNRNIVALDPNVFHPCQINGLYCYTSIDGIHWNLLQNKPILHGFHKGQQDKFRGYSEYDGHLSLDYLPDEECFVLYGRANVGRGSRFIQYAKSKDLTNWSPLNLISISPKYKIGQNYYFPNFHSYPGCNNYYIGFLPYVVKDQDSTAGIYLTMSTDGKTWKRYQKIRPTIIRMKDRNSRHPVAGIIVSDDGTKFYTYVQENYFRGHRDDPFEIKRYEIRKDGYHSFYSKDGNFSMKVKVSSGKLVANYKCHQDGWISFSLNDQEPVQYTDDQLDQVIFKNLSEDEYDLKVHLHNSEIFSLRD